MTDRQDRHSRAIGPPSIAEMEERLFQIEQEYSEILSELDHDRTVTGKELRRALKLVVDRQSFGLQFFMTITENQIEQLRSVEDDGSSGGH